MKRKKILFAALVLLSGASLLFSATNPRWISEISMSTANPLEGAPATFSAQFKVKQGPVDNLQVVAQLDGSKIFEKTYPHLNLGDVETFTVNWTAVAGNHIIKFIIDPLNSSGDINPDDNVKEKTFSVQARKTLMMRTTLFGKPDLEVRLYSVNPSPAFGDTIELSAKVKNIGTADAKPCNLRFKMGSVIIEPTYEVPLIKAERHFEVTIARKLDRIGTYHFKAELFNSSDDNQGNNSSSLTITPRAPDLVITKWEARQFKVSLNQEVRVRVWVKNAGNADSGYFEVDAYFEPCKGIAQGRKWFHVDNLKPGEEIYRDFTHKFKCIGLKNLNKIWVDKDNLVIEPNEINNIVNPYRIFEVGMPWR